ncbi:hypothetical protein ASG01_08910 [Chryseobacterium sp. Leaf180]|uniref:NUMOD4 domain-containing protein n=1 Tax=Chryseobacterium sp. Leaf180 TaxID=1736289 RepID=UPI0006F1EC86|nr:NUMOD4 domain-containing protein [Chryseobacterium sp. Leaf180]KQR93307.1 hypothetical protein ASG01_08910 [Chryseobacterium sp. Leaf180]
MYQPTIKDTLSTNIESFPGEIWSDIPGYKDRYMISNYSRVKSIIYERSGKVNIIKKSYSSGKYKVTLICKRGKRKNPLCGRLCATVFLRPPEENEVVRYLDGNCRFDVVSNLRWTSKKDSTKEAFANRRFPANHGTGDLNGMAKLSPSKVLEIRKSFGEGIKQKDLASQYGVAQVSIQKIVSGKTWKNIN